LVLDAVFGSGCVVAEGVCGGGEVVADRVQVVAERQTAGAAEVFEVPVAEGFVAEFWFESSGCGGVGDAFAFDGVGDAPLPGLALTGS
jgi:hypothetical protein